MDQPPVSGQPPPIYAPIQPQILVAPLPDAASFFWGRTVQGDIYVKGLGEQRISGEIVQLSVHLSLTNILPGQPDISLHDFPPQIVWPKRSPSSLDVSTSSGRPSSSFPTSHRFSINLPDYLSQSSSPSPQPLPGTVNLSEYRKGEVRWSLKVSLKTHTKTFEEEVNVEGTPTDHEVLEDEEEVKNEAETKVDKVGVSSRLLVEDPSPRLGSLLRLGVEIKPKDRQRTGVAALASQPDPAATLRPLRRVRVELYRLILVHPPSSSASTSRGRSASTESDSTQREHLSLLHASGKSLRFPGTQHPPLRVLFTLPTAQTGSTADATWGEISASTPYHTVTFFVRVTLGFGALAETAPEEIRDWVLEQKITIRPKIWKEPRQVVLERGMAPTLGVGEEDSPVDGQMTDEELAKEMYRLKGSDTVGASGTLRESNGEDGPPDFNEAGPSHTSPATTQTGLPTFLESEAAAASGEAPVLPERVMTERLIPVDFEQDITDENRNVVVGRRGSLKGELGTWVEYDGYETFSVAPPSVAASFGASGIMDPPQPEDEENNVGGGMAARLGISGIQNVGGLELMDQLGLGEGSRVVDMQDDLPPGIDEPSLPALPTFNQSTQYRSQRYRVVPHPAHPAPIRHDESPAETHTAHDISPPSFDASEAAQAAGNMASPRLNAGPPSRRESTHPNTQTESREDPPEYFGAGSGASVGGPPAYS